jgi:hypothetical protein
MANNTTQAFPAPPFLSPFFEDQAKTIISRAWQEWLREITNTLGAATPITGSIAGGAALTNLINALQELGLVKNNTTP